MGGHRCAAAAMGFDPRTWAAASPRGSERAGPRVTANLEALLAENLALQREVALLRRELAERDASRARPPRREAPGPRRRGHHRLPPRHQRGPAGPLGGGHGPPSALGGSAPRGRRGRRRPGGPWSAGAAGGARAPLPWRGGRPGGAARSPCPGLGQELRAVLRGPPPGASWRCGPPSPSTAPGLWKRLSGDPLRVVDDLLEAIARLEPPQRPPSAGSRPVGTAAERRRAAALRELGLESGASPEAIKAAHRRLVKRHHPDVGGDAEEFRRINAAYQQLVAEVAAAGHSSGPAPDRSGGSPPGVRRRPRPVFQPA